MDREERLEHMLFCIDEGLTEFGCTTGTTIERTAIASREVLKVADDRLSVKRLAAEAKARNNKGGIYMCIWDLVHVYV